MTRKVFLATLAMVGSMLVSAVTITNSQTFAATPVDACFTRSGSTITNYTVGGVNNCPTNVDIPATIGGVTITAIGDSAFRNKGITAFTLPSTITTIGISAFNGTNSYTSVTIPSSVTSIGQSAFQSVSSLQSVTIQNAATSIGNSAFFGCTNLTSVNLGNAVTSIGQAAFYQTGITSITIPNTVTSIANNTFTLSKLVSVSLPNSITSIGFQAFASTNLTSVIIPTSVTSIGDNAFDNSKLVTVSFSNGLTSIGTGAFSNNQLQSVHLPNSVTTMGSGAFSTNQISDLVLSTSLQTIPDQAFYSNKIASLDIPPNIKNIGFYGFAFNPITSLTLYEGLQTIGVAAFASYQGLSGDEATSIGTLVIPDSVTTIEAQAFMGTGVTSLTLGSGVTSIPEMAFLANDIETANIPNNVTYIAYNAFALQSSTKSMSLLLGSGTLEDYEDVYYTRLYTSDPTNPNGLSSGVYVASEQGIDLDGNGATDNFVSYGGHLINPVSATVTYKNTAGVELRPSETKVGEDISNYLVVNDPNTYPAPADTNNGYTQAEIDAASAQLSAAYYKIGSPSLTYTAPAIDGYDKVTPSSPATLALASATNTLNFVYSNTDGSIPAEDQPRGSETDLADTGVNVYVVAVAAIAVIAIGQAIVWRRLLVGQKR